MRKTNASSIWQELDFESRFVIDLEKIFAHTEGGSYEPETIS